MKTLKQLVLPTEIIKSNIDLERKISDITQDSRLVQSESLFVAVRGTQKDGHSFVKEVLKKGAMALVDKDYR